MMSANLQLTDYDAEGRPETAHMASLKAPLSALLTDELDGAAANLGVTGDEILVAALGRAIQRTIGDGVIAVDVPGHGSSVQSLALTCVAPGQSSATEMLSGIHHSLAAMACHRIVHGEPADLLAQPTSDVLFAYGDAAVTERAHAGHVLELHALRGGDELQLEWWYDVRSFESYTVEELAEQFPLALIELTSEAVPPLVATSELAMAY